MTMLMNILVIVFGVAIASAGEIEFSWIGFLFQVSGTVFEAVRLVMIQVMLNGEGMKMDPLVGLYYYAPVCALMNLLVAIPFEVPKFEMQHLWDAGIFMLILNALVAFMLNIASVCLVSSTEYPPWSHVETNAIPSDWQDIRPCYDPHRHPQEHPPRCHLRHHLANQDLWPSSPRLCHRSRRSRLLFTGLRPTRQVLPFHHLLDHQHLEDSQLFRGELDP